MPCDDDSLALSLSFAHFAQTNNNNNTRYVVEQTAQHSTGDEANQGKRALITSIKKKQDEDGNGVARPRARQGLVQEHSV
jgi:hypothetical protein